MVGYFCKENPIVTIWLEISREVLFARGEDEDWAGLWGPVECHSMVRYFREQNPIVTNYQLEICQEVLFSRGEDIH